MRSATRTRVPAHWASWADSPRMIHSRHPEVAETMVRCLCSPTDTGMRHFSAAASCHADLRARGYSTPEWEDLPTALPRALAALVPGVLAIPENGWQHDASLVLEQRFTDTVVVPRASPAQRALLRSQGGPLSGLPFTTSAFLTAPVVWMPPPSSPTVLSLLPVWPSSRLPWPSPCQLFEGRVSGEARLRIGVCGGMHLSRGWRQSVTQCVLA